MNNKIDPCDTMRVNLIAAAVGLQQCTKTESNVVPIPGGDRVIAIGTPAQVRALLAAEMGVPTDPLRLAVREMAAALESREWAEHVSCDPDLEALEVQITELVNQHAAALVKQAVVAPSGYKLVPLSCTPDMRAAWDRSPQSEDDDVDFHRAYRAMLDAAPAIRAVDAAAICDGVAAKSKNSLFRSGAKICAGEIRAAHAAAADHDHSEGGHHD